MRGFVASKRSKSEKEPSTSSPQAAADSRSGPRPAVIVVAPPRCGAGLVARLLAVAPGWGPSGLSGVQLEDRAAGLAVEQRGYESHRLSPDDAEAIATVRELVQETSATECTVDWNPRLMLRVGLVAEALPEVDLFLGASESDRLIPMLHERGLIGDPVTQHPGVRLYAGATPFVRYLKVSEGCDHGCAFCAIPLMRGLHISRPVEELVLEARNLARRGVSSNFNDPGQRERIEQTLLNRYGVSNPFESPVFQEKAKKTRLLRYGDEIYSNPSKASDTKLTRYGEGHKKIVDKIKETKLNKYGDENFNNRPKAIGTNISKYGVENTSQVVDIHERMQKSRWYTIISPSCIEYKVQGYERFVVPILWKTYTEDTLVLHRAKMPAVFYIGNDTKKHRYYPDIYLKEEKTIIDVKSTWWLKLSVPKLEKLFPRCNELGYIFKIILYDKGETEYLNTIEEVYSKVKTL